MIYIGNLILKTIVYVYFKGVRVYSEKKSYSVPQA